MAACRLQAAGGISLGQGPHGISPAIGTTGRSRPATAAKGPATVGPTATIRPSPALRVFRGHCGPRPCLTLVRPTATGHVMTSVTAIKSPVWGLLSRRRTRVATGFTRVVSPSSVFIASTPCRQARSQNSRHDRPVPCLCRRRLFLA